MITRGMRYTSRFVSLTRAIALAAAFVAGAPCASTVRAQSNDLFYYWATPFGSPAPHFESFVITVDSAHKSQIDAIIAQRHVALFDGRIAAGEVSYNRNYYAPGHPVWNWHFTSVDTIHDYNTEGYPLIVPERGRNYYSDPSDIAADPNAWIAQNGDYYYPTHYAIAQQIDPSKRDALANVSNRGFAGAGEKTLISGFIITGGEPRNVVVRALGPSLASAGVKQYATNPKIDIFDGSGNKLRSNDDWKNDSRASELSQDYPALAPSNDKEAARLMTLMPGNYTIQGSNEDGTEGVMLLEAYDVDYQTQ